MTQTFTKWSDDNYNTSRTIDADNTKAIEAEFNGVPQKVTGFYYDCSAGQDIKFRWTRHPNSNVTYKIYRKVKNVHGPTVIATLSNATTVYTDPLYQKTAGYTDDLLYYDVRAYYNPDYNLAVEDWHAVYGEMGFNIGTQSDKIIMGVIPEEFSISNYPNPFNPTTSIQYSLPERSIVKLGIYNLNGNKIREWKLVKHQPESEILLGMEMIILVIAFPPEFIFIN